MILQRNSTVVSGCLAILLGMIVHRADSMTWTLTYDYDEINMTATVTGIVATTEASLASCIRERQDIGHLEQTLEIPATTTDGYRVVGIGDYAFDCAFSSERFGDESIPTVTAIVFPNTITNIGVSAFNCCDTISIIEIPSGIKNLVIRDEAFHGCRLSSVSIPEGVVSIGAKAFAFQGRGDFVLGGAIVLPISLKELGYMAFATNVVERIEFKCAPPVMSKPYWYDGLYGDIFWQEELTEGAFTNWGVETVVCPSRYAAEWKKFSQLYDDSYSSFYVDFVLPDIIIVGMPTLDGETPESVTNAIIEAGFSDAEAIMTAIGGNYTNFNAFCDWAQSVKGEDGALAGEAAVVRSQRTAVSWLLGADRLIPRGLTSEDVKIESFMPSSTDGRFEFTVSVKDVNIGGGSVTEAVLKENLKKVLGIEGAKSLSSGTFSSDNIDITFDTPVDGKAKFTVSPPADAGNSFFMRVKVK